MEVEEIIQSSLDTLTDKKQVSKDMHHVFKDASEKTKIPPEVLRRVKDYNYYFGRGWQAGNPLDLDKEEKFKDKVSPVFIKLLTIVDDLYKVCHVELLDEYFDAMNQLGIHIDVSDYRPEYVTYDSTISDDAVAAGVNLQSSICQLADQIKDEDSINAEQKGFGPKREYIKLINLAYSKRKGKDIEDKCQEAYAEHAVAINSYDKIKTEQF